MWCCQMNASEAQTDRQSTGLHLLLRHIDTVAQHINVHPGGCAGSPAETVFCKITLLLISKNILLTLDAKAGTVE